MNWKFCGTQKPNLVMHRGNKPTSVKIFHHHWKLPYILFSNLLSLRNIQWIRSSWLSKSSHYGALKLSPVEAHKKMTSAIFPLFFLLPFSSRFQTLHQVWRDKVRSRMYAWCARKLLLFSAVTLLRSMLTALANSQRKNGRLQLRGWRLVYRLS